MWCFISFGWRYTKKGKLSKGQEKCGALVCVVLQGKLSVLVLILLMEMKQYHCFTISLVLLALISAVGLGIAMYINSVLLDIFLCSYLVLIAFY